MSARDAKVTSLSEKEAMLPHVTHDDYPEITLRGVILAAILAVVLGAANIYLGLLVGLTVSASIPASVISMACLRLFKDSNILENNIVQTAASAGEALAAGVIFTLPGLVIMNNKRDEGDLTFANVDGWDSFTADGNYWYSTFLAMFGGLLGIAWSVPLRRALIVDIDPPLTFPEGVATAQVLKSGEQGGRSVMAVLAGGTLGAVVALLHSMGLWISKISFGWFYRNKYPSYFALDVKASLLGVGYIVGPKIAGVLFIGSMLNYWVIIPVSCAINNRHDEASWNVTANGEFTPENVAGLEFVTTRYMGVGMMIIGGVWSLISIRHALFSAVRESLKQFRSAGKAKKSGDVTNEEGRVVRRYEIDIPFHWVAVTVLGTSVPLYCMFSAFSNEWGYCVIMSIFVAFTSFIFSAVAAYMAGLVGSSNNPVSGVTICSSLILSGLILAMFGADNPLGPPTAVMMCCAVATACAISGDNMQDLKAGHMLGATPWKQEIIMAVGVISTSFVVGPILELLDSAYTLGEGLQAPQATVIATIPSGLISGTLPWDYIGAGIGMGAIIIMIDILLEKYNAPLRLPVLAFAIATYLPNTYLTPIFLGSLVHFLAGTDPENQAAEGVLYAAGLVAGDSIFGILLAIPVVATSNANVLQVIADPVNWPVIFPLFAILASMTYFAKFEPFTSKDKQLSNERNIQNEKSFDVEESPDSEAVSGI